MLVKELGMVNDIQQTLQHGSTLLDIPGKSKDRLNARRDLVDLKLRSEVSTELEVGNTGVSDNLRWIVHGPHPFVITYSGYAINGCRYHTKSSEKDRSVQNSGNSGGGLIDELGYILVDLNRVGQKSDSFILASQGKQVFYVKDPSDVRWSVVLTPPQRDFEDRYNDDELGDTTLQCEETLNDMTDVDLNNDLDGNISTYVRSNSEGTWIPR
ncbi:transposase [Cucumis melo var. makuwa]|uniref:Transposase n=1 Tax=Cucumis melo var. makuwa TaxID=1194695 RepID=A0A5A7T3S7_CUCMM|nr:transposase [Cucumis melo var. makuwa]TYK13494.1 transposase [Cucumis melo var. makuwa]